ncbi:uncharacterized protein FIBRA_02782 [Fibroporia radiculosa]|uniref:Uncharacterized protein n=1 Tax=Fibroporia radiculosa TaxID=599839 RepID=J4HVH4_9APHY|nr:uncharacterized protein FIBRA_02782 [Fibroporia radiculosa]CCM00742.1 predicted protein [Fibroporia radiculosa]
MSGTSTAQTLPLYDSDLYEFVPKTSLITSTVVESDPGLRLSPTKYPWPYGFNAAVSKILNEANIPAFIWGDLLNNWRGNPHMPHTCGFVVPAYDFERAVEAISGAGLPMCTCEDFLHVSESGSPISLPVHFVVPQEYVPVLLFLCPSDLLLDLLPITPAHPNPASLYFDRIKLPFTNSAVFLHDDPTASSSEDYQVVCALTASSLIKAWLLLDALSPPNRRGISYTYAFLLHIMAVDVSPGQHDFHSKSLQALWQQVYLNSNCETTKREELIGQVRLEWGDRIPHRC